MKLLEPQISLAAMHSKTSNGLMFQFQAASAVDFADNFKLICISSHTYTPQSMSGSSQAKYIKLEHNYD